MSTHSQVLVYGSRVRVRARTSSGPGRRHPPGARAARRGGRRRHLRVAGHPDRGQGRAGRDARRRSPTRAAVPPPALAGIDAVDTLRTRTAVAELRDAVADADETRGRATLAVRHGDGDEDDDSYRLGGTPEALRITATSETGAVRGIYDLALAVREAGPSPSTSATGHVAAAVPDGRPRCRRCRPRPRGVARGHRLLPQLRAFEDVILPGRAVRRPDGAGDGAAPTFDDVRRARGRRGVQRDRGPGLPRVRHLRRASACYDDGRRPRRARRRRCATTFGADLAARPRPRSEGLLPHRHARAHDAARGVLREHVRLSTPRTPSCGTSTRTGSTSSTARCRTSTAC